MNQIRMDLIRLNNISNPYNVFAAQIDPQKYNKPDKYSCPPEIIKRMYALKHGVRYESHISNQPIELFFFTHKRDPCLDARFHIVMTILRYMMQFVPPKPVKVDFVLTDIKKELPLHGELIGPSTLNTGYTDGINIVVYREEEWLKVFIHECMHFFMYDAELRNKPRLLYHLFPVHTTLNVNESYCEIWARILNCCVISVMNDKNVYTLLENERKFSAQQMVKILNYMHLTYDDLTHKGIEFHENTNAFAYLVLTAIAMHDPESFVDWCIQNTPSKNILRIKHAQDYVEFIQERYQLPGFKATTHRTNRNLSTKMSINNIQLYYENTKT